MSRVHRPAHLPPVAPVTPIAPAEAAGGYVPGACNIGPWEIRRRRAFAITGFAVAAALLVWLIAAGAPAPTRIVLLLPLWGGAFSWLQARRRFCAAFAIGGVANFGVGAGFRQTIGDPVARRADLLAVARMTRDSFPLAVAATLVVVLLPV
jgi:hypothetical protein